MLLLLTRLRLLRLPTHSLSSLSLIPPLLRLLLGLGHSPEACTAKECLNEPALGRAQRAGGHLEAGAREQQGGGPADTSAGLHKALDLCPPVAPNNVTKTMRSILTMNHRQM